MTAAEIKQLVEDLRTQGSDTRRVEAKAARKAVPKGLYESLRKRLAFAKPTEQLAELLLQ